MLLYCKKYCSSVLCGVDERMWPQLSYFILVSLLYSGVVLLWGHCFTLVALLYSSGVPLPITLLGRDLVSFVLSTVWSAHICTYRMLLSNGVI